MNDNIKKTIETSTLTSYNYRHPLRIKALVHTVTPGFVKSPDDKNTLNFMAKEIFEGFLENFSFNEDLVNLLVADTNCEMQFYYHITPDQVNFDYEFAYKTMLKLLGFKVEFITSKFIFEREEFDENSWGNRDTELKKFMPKLSINNIEI